MAPAVREGFVGPNGQRVWYQVVGDGDRTPLLMLHGGPGAPWPDGMPAVDLLAADRPIVLYHQLGCGRSDDPADPARWTLDAFAEEVGRVREALDLTEVHLLGWSWGGLPVLRHVLDGGAGIRSLVLFSPVVSVPLWTEETGRLRDALPPRARAAIARYETSYEQPAPKMGKPRPGRSGEWLRKQARMMRKVMPLLMSAPVQHAAEAASRVKPLRGVAHQAVMLQFIRRHVMVGDPPVELFTMLAGMNNAQYEAMWGAAEWWCTGNLRDVDLLDRLPEVQVPTLVLVGRHDEATPAMAERIVDHLASGELRIMEDSAHCSILEQPTRFAELVGDFLRDHD